MSKLRSLPEGEGVYWNVRGVTAEGVGAFLGVSKGGTGREDKGETVMEVGVASVEEEDGMAAWDGEG